MMSSVSFLILLLISVTLVFSLSEAAQHDGTASIAGMKNRDELLRSLREARSASQSTDFEFVKETIERIKRQVQKAVNDSPLMSNPVVTAIIEPLFALIRTVTDYIIHLSYVLLGIRQA